MTNHRPQLGNLVRQLVKLQVPAMMLLHLPSIVSLAAVLRLTLQLVVKPELKLEIRKEEVQIPGIISLMILVIPVALDRIR